MIFMDAVLKLRGFGFGLFFFIQEKFCSEVLFCCKNIFQTYPEVFLFSKVGYYATSLFVSLVLFDVT